MRRLVCTSIVAALLLIALVPAAGAGPPPSESHLDQVIAALDQVSPQSKGTVWRDTTGNALEGDVTDWFLQTPNCWGTADCPDPVGTQRLLAAIADVIGSAQQTVDITTLWPFANGGFQDAIVTGLRQALTNGHRPTVRVVSGNPYFVSYSGTGPSAWRAELLAEIGPLATQLPIAVAVQTTNLQSWNHAKMVSVDGREAIVGGHNMWAASYLSATPVSDVSIRVAGPAARAATDFANILWSDLCQRKSGWLGWISVRYSASNLNQCPRQLTTAPPPHVGDIRILSVGRLGIGVPIPGTNLFGLERVGLSIPCPFRDQFNDDPSFDRRNPGATAARALVASAEESIFISQQDLLGFCPRYDKRMFQVLADQMIAGVDVSIVVTGAFGTSYANMESLYDLSEQLFEVLVPIVGDGARAKQIMCSSLQLASLQIGTATKWPDTTGFANHAKFISVDDEAFAVGSGNMYPANLQELDYMVEDTDAAAAVRLDYLDPLWQWSSATAIIDRDRGICQISPPLTPIG